MRDSSWSGRETEGDWRDERGTFFDMEPTGTFSLLPLLRRIEGWIEGNGDSRRGRREGEHSLATSQVEWEMRERKRDSDQPSPLLSPPLPLVLFSLPLSPSIGRGALHYPPTSPLPPFPLSPLSPLAVLCVSISLANGCLSSLPLSPRFADSVREREHNEGVHREKESRGKESVSLLFLHWQAPIRVVINHSLFALFPTWLPLSDKWTTA